MTFGLLYVSCRTHPASLLPHPSTPSCQLKNLAIFKLWRHHGTKRDGSFHSKGSSLKFWLKIVPSGLAASPRSLWITHWQDTRQVGRESCQPVEWVGGLKTWEQLGEMMPWGWVSSFKKGKALCSVTSVLLSVRVNRLTHFYHHLLGLLSSNGHFIKILEEIKHPSNSRGGKLP